MPARATRGYDRKKTTTHLTFSIEFFLFYRTTRTTLAESRCPELLAQYCDILLRKGTSTHKKYSSEEIEIKLKDVVRIFILKIY